MALTDKNKGDIWARPGMKITFRAEIMPGVKSEKRTFCVKEVLSNGSVTLLDFDGQYDAASFLPVQFRKKSE